MIAALQATAHLHDGLRAGVGERDLDWAERALGGVLPAVLRTLWSWTDGADFLHGNLRLHTLRATLTESERLRSWGWDVPPGTIAFASDGAGGGFGFPAGREGPVVMLGGPILPSLGDCVGATVEGFLRGWSAYYVQLIDDDPSASAALDLLGVPPGLRHAPAALGDRELEALLRWSDGTQPAHR